MQGCRAVAAVFALVLVVAACSNSPEPVDVQRVVATPAPTARVKSTVETPKPTATAAADDEEGEDERDTPTPSRTTTPQPTVRRDLAELKIEMSHVADVPRPTAMAVRPGDPGMYVASKNGFVRRLVGRAQEVVLDISNEVSGGSEQGLLGLAFSRSGDIAVINFTDTDDASVTRAYRFDGTGHTFGTHKDLFVVDKPTEMHNGGNVAFGRDGYLYVSIGDGGQSGDPKNNAQSLATFLGKILRVDVRSDLSYRIPSSNPFADDPNGKDEIWAYGFRNPWRFSFDQKTGDLWISDVGRDRREEINLEPAGSGGGRNYGWNRMEGSIPYDGRSPPANHVPPVYDYEHSPSRCVVIGGHVYRGDAIPDLRGAFLFSDYCEGGIQAIRVEGGRVAEHRHFKIEGDHISSFGQTSDGEVYALALVAGKLYRIDPR